MNTSNPFAVEFLQYNRWANLHLIDALLALTPEQLASSAPGTYGSIYDTLVHIIQAESRYYQRLTGVGLVPSFSWEASPSLLEMRSFAELVSGGLVEAAEKMKITDSFERDWHDAEWEGQRSRYRSVSMLIQVVNHGVEHRTNITTIQAQQGIEAPALDGWEFMRQNPDRMGAE